MSNFMRPFVAVLLAVGALAQVPDLQRSRLPKANPQSWTALLRS